MMSQFAGHNLLARNDFVYVSQHWRTETASYLVETHMVQVCTGTTKRTLVEKAWVHRCQVNRGSGPHFHCLHHHYSHSVHHLQELKGHSQTERCNMPTVIETHPTSYVSA